jgi:hypothetical protein
VVALGCHRLASFSVCSLKLVYLVDLSAGRINELILAGSGLLFRISEGICLVTKHKHFIESRLSLSELFSTDTHLFELLIDRLCVGHRGNLLEDLFMITLLHEALEELLKTLVVLILVLVVQLGIPFLDLKKDFCQLLAVNADLLQDIFLQVALFIDQHVRQ